MTFGKCSFHLSESCEAVPCRHSVVARGALVASPADAPLTTGNQANERVQETRYRAWQQQLD